MKICFVFILFSWLHMHAQELLTVCVSLYWLFMATYEWLGVDVCHI